MAQTKKAQGETPIVSDADAANKALFEAEAARAQAYRDRPTSHAAPEEGGPGFEGEAPGDDVRQAATLSGQVAALAEKAQG